MGCGERVSLELTSVPPFHTAVHKTIPSSAGYCNGPLFFLFWLKTTDVCYLTVLETLSLKSNHLGHAPSETCRRTLPRLFLHAGGCLQSLAFFGLLLHHTRLCLRLYIEQVCTPCLPSRGCLLIRMQSYWIRSPPLLSLSNYICNNPVLK